MFHFNLQKQSIKLTLISRLTSLLTVLSVQARPTSRCAINVMLLVLLWL